MNELVFFLAVHFVFNYSTLSGVQGRTGNLLAFCSCNFLWQVRIQCHKECKLRPSLDDTDRRV